MVSGAAGFTEPPGPQIFEDVPPGHTFYEWINRLANRDIITGYPCGGVGEPCVPPQNRPYFRSNANTTRGQLAKIVSEAAEFNEPIPSTQRSYQDVPNTHPFWVWIERLTNRGIVGGFPCGQIPTEPCVPPQNRPYFRSNANVTRGQTTRFVADAFFPGCQTPLSTTGTSRFDPSERQRPDQRPNAETH
jgi:hypothetical protein